MARSFARVQTSIWQDDDFRKLPGRAQRLYLLLLSQPDISYCGVLAYRPKRWALLASDSSAERVEAAVAELEAARFVFVDHATGELAVRTFARNDGVLDNQNTRKAFWRTLDDVLSEWLRTGLLEGLPEGRREPDKDGSPNPRANRAANPRRKVGGKGEGGSTSGSSRRKTVVAPTTLDITEDMRAWAAVKAPGIDLERETERLLDWARGKGERKSDWTAAWRNWMRRASEERRTNGRVEPKPDRSPAWVAE